MPKMKTHRGTAKRVRVTGKGKLVYRRGGNGHFMRRKSSSRKRRLDVEVAIVGKVKARVRRLLGV